MLDGRGVERGDAVPQDIAAFGAHQQRALADGESRRADTDDAGVVFVEAVHVALRERRKRGPALPARRDILPLFLADHALRGRLALSGYCMPQAVQMERGMRS